MNETTTKIHAPDAIRTVYPKITQPRKSEAYTRNATGLDSGPNPERVTSFGGEDTGTPPPVRWFPAVER